MPRVGKPGRGTRLGGGSQGAREDLFRTRSQRHLPKKQSELFCAKTQVFKYESSNWICAIFLRNSG